MEPKYKFKVFCLILALACCWGPSFMFIKWAVGDIGPLTLVACRLTFGGLLLYVLLRLSGKTLWSYRHHWQHFVTMGIFASGLPFFLITSGEMYISSSLAAIMNSTTPICTMILAHFFITSDRINLNKGAGICLGFIGILIVFTPTLFDREGGSELGAFLVFLAAISYAVSMVYSKKKLQEVPPLVSATAQLLSAALMLIPLAFALEQPYHLPMPSLKAVAGIFGLSVLGTATAFPVYYTIVKIAGATALSTSTLLFPVIGVFLGVVILDEQVGANAYIGSAIILLGLAVANGLLRFDKVFGLKWRSQS